MIIANPVTYDARNPQTTVSTMAARAVAGRPKLAEARIYSLPAADRRAAAAGWQVREEPEDYIPDHPSDQDDATDPELIESADAHSEGLREAMRLLDVAENLLAVLVASMEDEGDSRAMQAETVLEIVQENLSEAHGRIDREDSRYRKLLAAYFELKMRAEKGEE